MLICETQRAILAALLLTSSLAQVRRLPTPPQIFFGGFRPISGPPRAQAQQQNVPEPQPLILTTSVPRPETVSPSFQLTTRVFRQPITRLPLFRGEPRAVSGNSFPDFGAPKPGSIISIPPSAPQGQTFLSAQPQRLPTSSAVFRPQQDPLFSPPQSVFLNSRPAIFPIDNNLISQQNNNNNNNFPFVNNNFASPPSNSFPSVPNNNAILPLNNNFISPVNSNDFITTNNNFVGPANNNFQTSFNDNFQRPVSSDVFRPSTGNLFTQNNISPLSQNNIIGMTPPPLPLNSPQLNDVIRPIQPVTVSPLSLLPVTPLTSNALSDLVVNPIPPVNAGVLPLANERPIELQRFPPFNK